MRFLFIPQREDRSERVLESLDLVQLFVGQGPGMTFALVILYIMIKDKKDASLRDVALTEAIHKLALEIMALRYTITDDEGTGRPRSRRSANDQPA